MPNIYARDLPRDLYDRIKKKKRILELKTWVSFFYEVDRILKKHIEEEKGIPVE